MVELDGSSEMESERGNGGVEVPKVGDEQRTAYEYEKALANPPRIRQRMAVYALILSIIIDTNIAHVQPR